VLARLNKIHGVQRSLANREGTLIRVSTTTDQVTGAVFQVLVDEKWNPKLLTADDLRDARADDNWFGPDELSAIEFRTLVLRQLREFAKTEKLDDPTTDHLVKFAEETWDRLGQAAEAEKGNQSSDGTDWAERCEKFTAAFLIKAKDVLTPEQEMDIRRQSDNWVKLLRNELARLRDGEECRPNE
jgi:hypothetical protein